MSETKAVAAHTEDKGFDFFGFVARFAPLIFLVGSDTFAKIEGAWYFAERKLIVDWSETRDLGSPTAA